MTALKLSVLKKFGFNLTVLTSEPFDRAVRKWTSHTADTQNDISSGGRSMDFLKLEPRPKLVVFDLDRTLWPFWVDTHVDPPFTKKSNGRLYDSRGQIVNHFSDVPEMLDRLVKEGYVLAAASRTGEIDGAEQLLHMWDWNKYFTHKEIYPGRKVTHFGKFKKNSSFTYDEMLFFDDEYRNIVDITKIGVTCYHCEQGMSIPVLEAGFKQYREAHSKGKKDEL